MSVETVGSILVGLAAGSVALLAFGGDSLVELISGVVVLRHLQGDSGSYRIKDRRTALLTTGLLFALIPVIGVGSVYSYLAGLRPEGSLLGIAIAVGAVILMPYLWLEKRRIGREARCLPLSIDAVESLTCILMSTALLAGLLAEFFLGLWWADYVATVVILLFVGREAWESFHEIREE